MTLDAYNRRDCPTKVIDRPADKLYKKSGGFMKLLVLAVFTVLALSLSGCAGAAVFLQEFGARQSQSSQYRCTTYSQGGGYYSSTCRQ